MEMNVGTNFRVVVDEYGGYTRSILAAGCAPCATTTAHDAVVALFGLEFNSVLVGLSYDLNLNALQANQRQGAFEISVAYLGDYENAGDSLPEV